VTRRVKSVAVVGRNAPVWLAALAIHRSLARAEVQVQVLELPSRLSDVDAYPTLPTLSALHALLGLDEQMLLQICHAVPVAAQRFANWSGGAQAFLLPYDDEPPPGGDLPFVHYWLKAKHEGLRVGFEDFSLGAAAARAGRVPVHIDAPMQLSAGYGYHLDARTYSGMLKQIAIRQGIVVTSSPVSGVTVNDGRITEVTLADGPAVKADLFVDASGVERALIGQMPGADFVSWNEWLPCDRMIAASAPRLNSLPGFSHIAAFRAGWIALRPLQNRTAVTTVYSSRVISDSEVAQQIPVLARVPVSGDAVVSALRQGTERRPWIGNCVAVGEAAIAIEPLDAVQLHTAHGCASHLMTLFPATADEFPEADVYNRTICRFAENIRDFALTHYKLNRRFDEPIWDAARERASPETLSRKIDLFAARGDVALYDDESFQGQGWIASLVGHGLVPETYDPRLDSVPEETQIAVVRQRLHDVAELVRQMPAVDQFVSGARQPEAAVL
jgi:tryptophan halogenase